MKTSDKVLKYDNMERPQFERLISDLDRAKHHWDKPGLREYSLVLIHIVGCIALETAGVVAAGNAASVANKGVVNGR